MEDKNDWQFGLLLSLILSGFMTLGISLFLLWEKVERLEVHAR